MSELEKVTAVDTTYDASEIQVLEGLEAVRKRPGMYIGSTSASGLHHLVYEIVDNAIDEALAGYCTEITVTINPGDTITVTDNGRGIPVDIQKQTGRPALEVVYTVLHAGGKFGGGGYKVSGGLHGVGASVVNALSEWLEVQVQKDGRIYEMKFSRGAITQEMKILGDTDQTGTAVTFKPDPEMFDTLVYDYETLHTRMREQAFLNAGLRITITDARPGQEQSDSMCYEGGIREFVTWLNRNKTALHEEVVYLAGAKGDSTAEVALQYNDSYNETLVSFANDIHTPEGGMHETGFKTALTRVLNAYGMKYGMIKEGDKVSGEDVREGITAVISVKLTEAQFEGQTKAKLGNASIRTLVDNVVSDQLAVYLEEHPVVARTILDKALTANRAREAARKARESIRRKTALGGAAMPDKLRDCNENNPELTDLYRGGRLRRRLCYSGTGLPVPGHPASVGQDAERGKGPGGQGVRQRQAPAGDHGSGGRDRRRAGPEPAAVSQDHHHGRCRCGRRPYPDAAADLLLPVYAAPDRGGVCLLRCAAAV